jgi:hypothetical protein
MGMIDIIVKIEKGGNNYVIDIVEKDETIKKPLITSMYIRMISFIVTQASCKPIVY